LSGGRLRHLEMLVQPKEIFSAIKTRAKVLEILRQFLNSRQFVEVETPILWRNQGGALARPFKTRLGDSSDLYLRIAPELFLKQLVVGGLDRVYEIGKVFRNEGIDSSHNPEFTTLEFYQAYANYEDFMELTQNLIREVVLGVKGSLNFKILVSNKITQNVETVGSKEHKEVEVDVNKPFQVMEIVPTLEKTLGQSLPDLNNDASLEILVNLCRSNDIQFSQDKVTVPHLIDKLIDHFLIPMCMQPTFLIHHPVCMSPLAKKHPKQVNISERFELYIGGMEICNAYSELNDPTEQERRLQLQELAKRKGDQEANAVNKEFVECLHYGLPPTAGFGLGIDRLCMILTGKLSIRDVILFPLLKNHSSS